MSLERKKVALIIGAGPAGLTAAYELLERTNIMPLVIEKTAFIGGLSRTACYKGNRIDIGGHRFFSKSERVMNWWLSVLPQETDSYSCKEHDNVMLMRNRKSRIYFMRTFFDYPLKLNVTTLKKLGFSRVVRIGISYTASVLFPIKKEKNLEDFFINRFGKELYKTFFKSYTEKVWGVSCKEISPEWGAQRIKGVSVLKTITHFFKQCLPKRDATISQKKTETSLIERFLYPKFGPGHMWEVVADRITKKGASLYTLSQVTNFKLEGNVITHAYLQTQDGSSEWHEVDYVFSTTSIQELLAMFPESSVPEDVKRIGKGLTYRDFITVGLLVDRLMLQEKGTIIEDNWIYIQEPDVLVGRLQIFNNWSPFLVADPSKVWIGLEYFCYVTDQLWHMSDQELIQLAEEELARIGILEHGVLRDGVVIKTEKAYPAYFGTYHEFDTIKKFLNTIDNLFLIGRNGQHKYNNQDHAMLTAMTVVDGLVNGHVDKHKVWTINTEKEYHETRAEGAQ